jgi:hypothetical protein
LDILLSGPALLYCGMFGATSSVDNVSSSSIRFQGTSNITFSTSVSVSYFDLRESGDYHVYCGFIC